MRSILCSNSLDLPLDSDVFRVNGAEVGIALLDDEADIELCP